MEWLECQGQRASRPANCWMPAALDQRQRGVGDENGAARIDSLLQLTFENGGAGRCCEPEHRLASGRRKKRNRGFTNANGWLTSLDRPGDLET